MTIEPEDAIRRYLTALSDPTSLIDTEAVTQLSRDLSGLTDPIDRLVTQQALLDAQEPDLSGAEEAFVANAGGWAKEHDITAAAFIAEGVEPAVLRRAGLRPPSGARSSGSKQRRASAKRPTRSRSRVTKDQIKDSVPPAPFTASTLIDLTGASPNSVRKTISELLDEGAVVEKGQDPDHTGPGRAPMLYAVT